MDLGLVVEEGDWGDDDDTEEEPVPLLQVVPVADERDAAAETAQTLPAAASSAAQPLALLNISEAQGPPPKEELNYAGPPASKIHSNPRTRYFVIKSVSHKNLVLSVENGVWATQRHNEEIFNAALHDSPHVILLFSVNCSGGFQGYAKMVGVVGSSAKAHVFKGFGRVFDVRWLRLDELPFEDVAFVTNPWNDGRPVKISKDGQELPNDVGRKLCQMIDEKVHRASPHDYLTDDHEVESGGFGPPAYPPGPLDFRSNTGLGRLSRMAPPPQPQYVQPPPIITPDAPLGLLPGEVPRPPVHTPPPSVGYPPPGCAPLGCSPGYSAGYGHYPPGFGFAPPQPGYHGYSGAPPRYPPPAGYMGHFPTPLQQSVTTPPPGVHHAPLPQTSATLPPQRPSLVGQSAPSVSSSVRPHEAASLSATQQQDADEYSYYSYSEEEEEKKSEGDNSWKEQLLLLKKMKLGKDSLVPASVRSAQAAVQAPTKAPAAPEPQKAKKRRREGREIGERKEKKAKKDTAVEGHPRSGKTESRASKVVEEKMVMARELGREEHDKKERKERKREKKDKSRDVCPSDGVETHSPLERNERKRNRLRDACPRADVETRPPKERRERNEDKKDRPRHVCLGEVVETLVPREKTDKREGKQHKVRDMCQRGDADSQLPRGRRQKWDQAEAACPTGGVEPRLREKRSDKCVKAADQCPQEAREGRPPKRKKHEKDKAEDPRPGEGSESGAQKKRRRDPAASEKKEKVKTEKERKMKKLRNEQQE